MKESDILLIAVEESNALTKGQCGSIITRNFISLSPPVFAIYSRTNVDGAVMVTYQLSVDGVLTPIADHVYKTITERHNHHLVISTEYFITMDDGLDLIIEEFAGANQGLCLAKVIAVGTESCPWENVTWNKQYSLNALAKTPYNQGTPRASAVQTPNPIESTLPIQPQPHNDNTIGLPEIQRDLTFDYTDVTEVVSYDEQHGIGVFGTILPFKPTQNNEAEDV